VSRRRYLTAILRIREPADGPLPFSELRRRVGIGDTGRFNYHLGKLCEYFVREVDGRYELGPAGTRVVDAAGEATTPDPETACPVCGEADCDRVNHVHLRTRR
jgi:hypothetical protein